jgi:polysaccharide export outer membrane protein
MSPRRLLATSVRLLASALPAALLAAACADTAKLSPPGFATTAGEATLDRVFRLGIGDKLKVTVFGEENLSSQAEVNASGAIAMPLIGEVPAKGRSVAELKEHLTRRLAEGYLKNPRVNVEVLNFRPIYVHGEVKSGGEFAFKNGITFRDAIAMAGGYTYRAQQSHLFLVREGGVEERVQLPSMHPVLPGDNIRIPERFF